MIKVTGQQTPCVCVCVCLSHTADLPSLISFLMQLGFMRVGKAYALDDLSASEQTTAGHMMQLGLLLPFEVRHTHTHTQHRTHTYTHTRTHDATGTVPAHRGGTPEETRACVCHLCTAPAGPGYGILLSHTSRQLSVCCGYGCGWAGTGHSKH